MPNPPSSASLAGIHERIFALGGDAILIGRPDGSVLVANPAACQVLGRTDAEIRGLGREGIVVHDERLARLLREREASGIARGVVHFRRADGAPFPVDMTSTVVPGADGERYAITIFRDVTEREAAAEALSGVERTLRMVTRCNEAILRAASEEELFRDVCRVIVEQGGYRMCWVGVAENDARRTIRPVAHAGHEDGYLHGLDVVWADAPNGRGPTGVAIRENRIVVGHDFGQEPVLAPWRERALARGYASSTALPISFEGEPMGVLTMYAPRVSAFSGEELEHLRRLAADVGFGVAAIRRRSEKERAERRLVESEQRFRALIEGSTDLTIVLDGGEIITFASPSCRETLGMDPGELVGRSGRDLVHPDDARRVGEIFATIVATRARPVEFGIRLRRADGTWAELEAQARNMLDVPAVRGIVINHRDVTEQRRLQAQFQQAQKLESVGRLAGGVAHDFNNLLTIILSCASDLQERQRAGRPADPEYLQDIVDAGRRASDLTRQLLVFARKQVVEPVTLDLNGVIRSNEKLLRRVIGEDVKVTLRLEPSPWHVRCDPGLMSQVLMNLAVNARDAMPGGGTLVLATRNVRAGDPAEPPGKGAPAGDHVVLEVRDTGSGMTDEVRAHLFEPFFTTKAPGAGTGLGLATVYGIVRQSGGHVEVRSAPGEGATFEIRLPRDTDDPAQEREAPVAPAGGNETILVVEDDAKVRDVTARMLRSGGYRVLASDGGYRASEIARAEPGSIDLLVTDLVMPGPGGREIARRIREIRPGVRVLYISGYSEDAIGRQGALEEGADLLHKPFTAPSILARVRAALDRR